MKLDKNNREKVNIGTILKDGYSEYRVINMWAEGKGTAVTLKCIKCTYPNNEWMTGRCLYGEPLSHCYGMEIVEGEDEIYERNLRF